MINRTKHLFYVRSNFHLTIALEIIKSKKIKINNLAFIVNRNVNIPSSLKKLVFKLDNNINFNFWDKLKFVLFNNDKLPLFLKDSSQIIAYIPFFSQLPFHFFNSNITFYEEGFSAYSSNQNQRIKFKIQECLKSIFRILIVYLFTPFKSKKLKAFIIGPSYFYKNFRSSKIFDYFVLSKNVNIKKFPNVNLKLVKPEVTSYEFNDSNRKICVVVMDRITSSLNFDIDNYKHILELIFMDFKDHKIYLKFHPFDNKKIVSHFFSSYSNNEFKYTVIDDSLEDLCLCRTPITFVGTNSTILFYAKLLGNNDAFSYSKKLSEIDPKYTQFLKYWGPDDLFYSTFEKNVNFK